MNLADPYVLGFFMLNFVYEKNSTRSDRKVAPYFAYGSHINQKLLEARVGPVQYLSRGILENYALTFTGKSSDTASNGHARLKFSLGSSVEGAIFLLTERQFQQICKAKAGRERTCRLLKSKITFQDYLKCKNGHPSEIVAGIFVSEMPQLQSALPRKAYLSKMLVGAKEIGLSESYIQKMRAHGDPSKIQLKSKL